MFETTIENEVETEEILICFQCGREIENGEENEVNEYFYCQRCFDRYFFTCYSCSDTFDSRVENENIVNNDSYCCDCFHDEFCTCESCDEIIERNDIYFDDNTCETLCRSCYDDLFTTCSRCEETTRRDNLVYVGGYGYCCEHCIENFSTCYGCGRYIDAENAIEDDEGEIYCENCMNQRDGIRSYSYKPNPIFQGTAKDNFFMGFELEVDRTGDNADDRGKADTARKVQEKFKYLYCKDDSSLSYGFETVSHPFSWKWYQENKDDFSKLLDIYRDNNWYSFEPGTCGIHVHISKRAFTSFHLFKFLKFFYNSRNFPFIKKISQRGKKNGYWGKDPESATNDQMIDSAKYKKSIKQYRNTAVNLMPHKTVEIRIFRGTTHLQSFLKNLEFVRSTFQFTKEYPPSKINLSSYAEYVLENRKEYPNLTSFMLSKGLFSLAINS